MDNQILDSDLYHNELHLIQASKGKRFANYLIDYFIAVLFAIVIFFIVDFLNLNFTTQDIIGNLFVAFLLVLYYIVFEGSLKGKTIGKYITKTRAVNTNGSTMDMSTVVKRSFSRIVPFEQLSFLGGPSTGWHDRWSDTLVIDETKSPQQLNN